MKGRVIKHVTGDQIEHEDRELVHYYKISDKSIPYKIGDQVEFSLRMTRALINKIIQDEKSTKA